MNAVVEFNQFESDLAEYKERFSGIVYDFDNPDEEKAARSDRLAIGKTIAELDRVHKRAKEPIKKQVDLIDGERKRIKDDLLSIQSGIKGQIERHEQKLREIDEDIAARVARIVAMGELPREAGSELINQRIEECLAMEIDDSFGNHQDNAAMALKVAMSHLGQELDTATTREAQEAELKQLRAEKAQREKEEARAKLEEAKALRERERAAEKEIFEARLLAEAKAREEAAVEAARETENARIKAAEQAAKEEEERRAASVRIRNRVHKKILNALEQKTLLSQEQAGAVLDDIAAGNIPNITITY